MGRNYWIMSGDTITAKWEDRKLSVINETLLPLYLKRVQDADLWLKTRAIDSHRANSRLLKKLFDSFVGYKELVDFFKEIEHFKASERGILCEINRSDITI